MEIRCFLMINLEIQYDHHVVVIRCEFCTLWGGGDSTNEEENMCH